MLKIAAHVLGKKLHSIPGNLLKVRVG